MESSWYAAPYISKIDDVKIIHVVRNPYSMAKSFYRVGLFNGSLERHLTKGAGWLRYSRHMLCSPVLALKRYSFVMEHRNFLKINGDLFLANNECDRLWGYWEYWNTLIERLSETAGHEYLRVKVEDGEDNIDAICDFIECSQDKKILHNAIDRNLKQGYEPVDFDKIYTAPPLSLKKMASKYGYTNI